MAAAAWEVDPLLSEGAPPKRGLLFTIRLAFYATRAYLCFFGLRKPWVVLLYSGVPPILGLRPKVSVRPSLSPSLHLSRLTLYATGRHRHRTDGLLLLR